MRKTTSIFILLFFLSQGSLLASNYYFSSAGGDDAHSVKSPDAPKKSLQAIQGILNAAEAGDTFFFEQGSVWYETTFYFSGIEGISEVPIVLTAYGTSKKPGDSGQRILEEPERQGNIYTFHDSNFPSPIDFVGANTVCADISKSDYNCFDYCRFIGAGEYRIRIIGQSTYPPNPDDIEINRVTHSGIADSGLGGLFIRYARGGYFANNHIHRINLQPGNVNQNTGDKLDGYALAIYNNLDIKPVAKQSLTDSVSGGIAGHYNNYTLSIKENTTPNYDMGANNIVTNNLDVSTKRNNYNYFFLDIHAPVHSREYTFGDSFIHRIYLDQDGSTSSMKVLKRIKLCR